MRRHKYHRSCKSILFSQARQLHARQLRSRVRRQRLRKPPLPALLSIQRHTDPVVPPIIFTDDQERPRKPLNRADWVSCKILQDHQCQLLHIARGHRDPPSSICRNHSDAFKQPKPARSSSMTCTSTSRPDSGTSVPIAILPLLFATRPSSGPGCRCSSTAVASSWLPTPSSGRSVRCFSVARRPS